MQSLLNKTHLCQKACTAQKSNSPEIGFCKALIICGLDGRLLLRGVKMDERDIGKDVAEPYILVADYVLKYQY